MIEHLTFEELPKAVTMLTNEVGELRRLLTQRQPEPVEQPEKLLTIQEAAGYLNLSVPTVYSKVSRGELPVMKRGKRLYFSKIELLEYLKGGRKKSVCEIEAEAGAYLANKKKG